VEWLVDGFDRKESLVMGRLLRGVVTASMTVAACLVVASPAQAAQADIVVGGASAISTGGLLVGGEVTCTGPTGNAVVDISALQVIPTLNSGSGSVSVPCADGPVAWQILLLGPSDDWASNYSVTVFASMSDGIANDFFTGIFRI
jgi:hypothetical protein